MIWPLQTTFELTFKNICVKQHARRGDMNVTRPENIKLHFASWGSFCFVFVHLWGLLFPQPNVEGLLFSWQ